MQQDWFDKVPILRCDRLEHNERVHSKSLWSLILALVLHSGPVRVKMMLMKLSSSTNGQNVSRAEPGVKERLEHADHQISRSY
jgi:predicted secreted protein